MSILIHTVYFRVGIRHFKYARVSNIHSIAFNNAYNSRFDTDLININ